MTVSTHGLRLKNGSHAWRTGVELLSSMRFSISLLTIICIASIIGTVLKQNEPINNYINQFGPFWAQVFASASLTSVYSAWWFMLILAFLVVSTSLCVTRNVPKIMRDWGVYKEDMRSQSLKAFGHTAQASLNESTQAAAQRIGLMLAGGGWKVKLQERKNIDGNLGGESSWMVAAKAGRVNKLGYIAAHSAIVLVCIGGLLDGDLIVKAQMLLNGKTAYSGGGLISDVKPEHRLSPSNPTFRANLLVAEGAQSSTAILNQGHGVLIQDLPFSIELKKFVVEHYSTGMPKLFASDIVIHDKVTGAKTSARVEVNHPVNYKGIEIFQSSFDDGGSTVKLKAVPLSVAAKPFEVEGVIGNATQLQNGTNDKLTLEFAALRVFNIENFGKDGAGNKGSAVDVRKVDLRESIDAKLGAANKTKTNKELRNVGPSITYKLRDAAGQAKEFHNYMLPVKMSDDENDAPVFLLGMRESTAEAFRYLRIPADDKGSMEGFLQLRATLADPFKRDRAVAMYAQKAAGADRPDMARQLALSASKAMSLFAGSVSSEALVGSAEKPPMIAQPDMAGLQAVADFIEKNVPVAEREKASEVLIRILNGALFELVQLTRAEAGLKPLDLSDKTQSYMMQTVLSLSDASVYPAPMAFMLQDFTQVQASVFQVASAPGKTVVYTGCALLILGVFAMLYIRERRVWVWLAPSNSTHGTQGNQGTRASMALSTNRKTMDGDHEFAHLTEKLIGAKPDMKPDPKESLKA
jgi:cytochrome c biogenesis protein